MAKITAPRTNASTTGWRPSAVATATYTAPHTTPEIEPARDFCNPVTPPPAPTKQARPTKTGQSCRLILPRWDMIAQTAATIPRLSALVVDALIGASEKGDESGANIMNGESAVQRRASKRVELHRLPSRSTRAIPGDRHGPPSPDSGPPRAARIRVRRIPGTARCLFAIGAERSRGSLRSTRPGTAAPARPRP